ncbi:MAG: serine/threonine-protein kinase, partial [Acidobacteriota bacterium]
RLEHPHIARLLGGGSTDDGEPFLVMELVEGQQLLDYCRSNALDLRGRLRLFLQVASAVEHAHRHLVVHRDLKPANILVHPASGPKLLDFGIAKWLDAGSDLPDLTRPQERLLTPDYASPEQVTGRPVTTASDVYSLGVVLCEMLTGRRPRQLEGLTPADQERRLTDTPPSRPSTLARLAAAEDRSADPGGDRPGGPALGALPNQLRGDLDTIILRALATDPERRYASVRDVASDIERYLRGEPVLARPDSWSYRGGKWVRRHPWGAAAVAAIASLVVAGVAGLVVYSQQLERERDRAVAAQVEARSVSDFLMHLFEVSDPGNSRGETVTARELLDRGVKSIGDGLEDEPEVRASLLQTLADVHRSLGLEERAAELHRRALDGRRRHLGPGHLETARSHDRLGDTLRKLGELGESERHLRRALRIRGDRLPPDAIELAETLNHLGLLLSERGDRGAAEPMLRRSLAIRLATLGPDHPETAVSRSNLGQLLLAERRLDEAATLLEAVLASRRNTLGEDHPKVALSLHTLGSLRQAQGRLDEAEALFRGALDIRRRVLPGSHPAIAQSLNNLASLLHDDLRLEEAGALYRESIEVDRRGAGHLAVEHAFTLNNLGSLL